MIKYLVLSAFLFVTGCGGGGGGSPAPAPVPAYSVTLIGDSLFAGLYLARDAAADLEAIRPGLKVDNQGISGWAMHTFLVGAVQASAEEKLVDAKYPGPDLGLHDRPFVQTSVAIIELGANDAYARSVYASYTSERFEAELRYVISFYQAKGMSVILTGIPPCYPEGGVFDQGTVDRIVVHNAIIHKVADELGLIHAGMDLLPSTFEDTFDGVHRKERPTHAFVEAIASATDKAFAPTGFRLQPR